MILNSQLFATAFSYIILYTGTVLQFSKSNFSVLNSQFSIVGYSSVVSLNIPTSNSQFSIILVLYCNSQIFKILSSQFSILNSQLLATAVFCFSISQIVILNSQLLNYFTAFSHLILVTGTMLYFSNIPDITAFFSYSSLAAMNLLSQIFLPCLPQG